MAIELTTASPEVLSSIRSALEVPATTGSQIFSGTILAENLIYNTGNQTISGIKSFDSRPFVNGTGVLLSGEAAEIALPSSIVYNTGNQNISGQKRFVDEDITLLPTSFSLNSPSTFVGGYSGPGVYRFVPAAEYRPVVFPNPNHYYSGLNSSPHVEIYYNTGTSRWWFTYNNILQDASPIVQPSSLSAKLPLTNWSGGNMRIYPSYSHNISHYADGNDPINPILINAVAITGGNQTISGTKTFVNNQTFSGNINVSGTGIFNSIDLNNIDNLSLSGVDVTIQNATVDLNNSTLINAMPEFVNESANFIISGNDNSRVILANSSFQITGTIVSGNPIGFNTTIIQINSGIQITGAGAGIVIQSYNNQFRTAGRFAAISLLHIGNNQYIMYGNTA